MPIKPPRPGAVTFVAVVLFLVGGYSVVMGCCGAAMVGMTAFSADMGDAKPNKENPFEEQKRMQQRIATEVPGYYIVTPALAIVDVAFGAGQILAGIGLLRLSSMARIMAMLLTLVKLLIGFAGHAYSVIYVVPVQSRIMEENPPPEGAPFDIAAFTRVATYLVLGLVVAIQLVILFVIVLPLLMSHVCAAFAAANAPPSEEGTPERRDIGYEDE